MTADEGHRVDRLLKDNPTFEFPLFENDIDKKECYQILQSANIELPMMYKLGFNNNNCRGCVKGGMGYWNRIRVHFPDIFDKMAKLERELGRSCINGTFLDELKPTAGRHNEPNITCDLLCRTGYLAEELDKM